MLVTESDGLKMTFQALQAKVNLTDTFGCSRSQIVTGDTELKYTSQ